MDMEKAKEAGRLYNRLSAVTEKRETLRQWKNNFPRSMTLSSEPLGNSFDLKLTNFEGFDPAPMIKVLISQADQRIMQIENQIKAL